MAQDVVFGAVIDMNDISSPFLRGAEPGCKCDVDVLDVIVADEPVHRIRLQAAFQFTRKIGHGCGLESDMTIVLL